MQFKNGDKVEAINENGIVQYSGYYLGQGYPAESVGVKDRSKLHFAVQVTDGGDVVYLNSFYWSLRQIR